MVNPSQARRRRSYPARTCFPTRWQTDFARALALTENGGWFLSLAVLELSWEPPRLASYFPSAGWSACQNF